MIDWIVFYTVSAIFQPYHGGEGGNVLNIRDINGDNESTITTPPTAL